MRAMSVARPMMPPSASTSRTTVPLAIPPIAGLHDIWPMVSRFCVSSSVRAPRRAASAAASAPAWPPPMTMTSYETTRDLLSYDRVRPLLTERAEWRDRRHVGRREQDVLLFDANAELRSSRQVLRLRAPCRRIVHPDIQQVDAGGVLGIETTDVGARPTRLHHHGDAVKRLMA